MSGSQGIGINGHPGCPIGVPQGHVLEDYPRRLREALAQAIKAGGGRFKGDDATLWSSRLHEGGRVQTDVSADIPNDIACRYVGLKRRAEPILIAGVRDQRTYEPVDPQLAGDGPETYEQWRCEHGSLRLWQGSKNSLLLDGRRIT